MITVVNEPRAEYKVTRWPKESKGSSFEDLICGIENATILYCPPTGSTYLIFSERSKRKLSALRGKMTMQSKKEIDDQISDLRGEWERNI